MNADYETNLGESSPHIFSATCAFCHVILSLDNNDLTVLNSISVCEDCKFLLLEDLEIPSPDMYFRRPPLSRRSYNSSESIESMFSQRFSQLTEDVNFRRYSDHGASDVSLDDYGESDTDIDPMNAGLYRWNSEEEEEDDSEWEEADIETSNTLGRRRGFLSEVEAVFPVGESGYYDDDENENVVESSVRGASVSFINSMARVSVDEGSDGVECAICKDSFIVGVAVNQLPCFHLFHPSCILPWLRLRNTCPVCRHEVPTDDRDYRASGGRNVGRSRWFFVAAPIVGIVGITLMLCFGGGKGWRVQVSQRRERRWSFF